MKTIGSLFAGIGGFDLGFERAGFKTSWAVEIDAKAQAVLRLRFPDANLHDDVREVGAHNLGPVDVVTFGSPCQDLSVAGKRAGLAGERSGLFHESVRVIQELRERHGKPDFAIWENVPGAFSSNGGRDFAVVVQEMVNLGARDVAWRVLDSRFFGVAQRRRRVFLVADFGGERAEQVLALTEGVRGYSAKGRKARQGVAQGVGEGAGGGRGYRMRAFGDYADDDTASTMKQRDHKDATDLVAVAFEPRYFTRDNKTGGAPTQTPALTATAWKAGDASPHVACGFYSNEGSHGMGNNREMSPSLKIESGLGIPSPPAGAFTAGNLARGAGMAPSTQTVGTLLAQEGRSHSDQDPLLALVPDVAGTLGGGSGQRGRSNDLDRSGAFIPQGPLVRRLTPVECCRLQGFPDDWNAEGIDASGKRVAMADSSRYRQLGNAVTVNVAQWIGKRMMVVL